MSLIKKIRNNRQLSQVLRKTKTTTAAIPAVEDATLQTWIKSIDSAVQAVVKKAVTKADLVDIGLAKINNGNLESLLPKEPDYNPTVPKAVLNLEANGAYSSVTVDWETPPSKLFGHNAVYRSEVDDFGTAVQIGSTLGDVYTDYVGNGIKAYYWVRTISKYGVEGELAPSVYAETSIDIAYLLEQLTGQINASQFDQSLRSKIDSIYTEAAAKIEIEKQIVAERLNVLNAISAESQERVSALKAQADTLRGEIQQKANDSAQNIRDISQDLAQEILSREGLSQRVDGVASKTNENTALVGRLEKTLTSRIESIAQEVTLVSAGVGEQFDTLFIYFFDTIETEETETTSAVWSAEGWTSQGGAPTVSNGWIKPYLNGENTVLISPVVEAFAGSAYSYVRFRIRKVGNPVWIGELVYNNKTLSIPEPTWDALSGIGTVNFNAEWVDDISQVKLKLAQHQDGSNHYLLDWFAFGRPSPAASWSAIGEVKQAIATETLARTEKTETIEASISANDTTYRALIQDAVDVAAEANRITGQRVESFILDTTPSWAGSEQEYAGDDGIRVGKWTETSARIEGDLAQAELTEQLFVNINNRVNADVTRIEQVIADKDSAYALEFNRLSAKMVGIPDGANFNTAFTAGIDQLKEAIVDEKGFLATSSLFETLKSDINGETTSQINELKRTYADDTFTQSITYTNLVSGTKLAKYAADNAQLTANNAKQAAAGAKETADDAKKRADDARQVADEATGKLNDISSDGKLTPLEKQQLKLVWDEVTKTHTELIKRAASYSVSTTAYLPTYTALSTYVTPLLSDMTATSNVVRSTFQANFANHYEARAVLGSLIATKAKTLSDDAKQAAVDAQNAADGAGVAASNAKKAADDARKIADEATGKLSDIAADGKLTPIEKQQLKLVWDEITKTHTELTKQATSYGLALTTYTPTYATLSTYITPLLSDTTTTSNIVRSTFQTNFSNHYAARATLANQISVKAKTLADAAKKAADDAQKRADDSFELAGGAKAAIDRYDETYTDKFLAAAESVTKIEASYNTGFAGSTEEYAGSDSYAGGFSIWSAIAEGDLAVSQRTDQLTASFNQSQADYQQQQILVAEQLRSLSSTSTILQANLDKGIGDVKKDIGTIQEDMATVEANLYKGIGDVKRDIATIQEDMVTVVDEKLGTASGKITALEKVVDGQKTSLEIVNAVGDVNLVKHEIAKSRLDKNTADLLLKKASTNTIIGDINRQIAALTLQKDQTGANVAEIDKQLAELNKAKADAQKVVSDIDAQVKQIQDDKKTLDDLLKTDSKIKAESTIKLDSHGVITSVGLAIEEDGAGTPQGVIAFRSHRFYVVPPGVDLTKAVVPFIIDNGKVIIDVALIKDGSIESAKIGNLSADKITSGDIAADRMKANMVAAISGQFTELSAITAKIGVLRTATSGARTEIRDNLIEVYDSAGRVRVKIGVF